MRKTQRKVGKGTLAVLKRQVAVLEKDLDGQCGKVWRLEAQLDQIKSFLKNRCWRTCDVRTGKGKLGHESNCPAYDLGLVD